jgi:hypothetical protein
MTLGDQVLETVAFNKDAGIRSLENLLCAGTSAFLISLTQLYPELQLISLVALVPFLLQASRNGLISSLWLGAFLGASICLANLPSFLHKSTGTILIDLGGFVLVFALYGATVNRIAKYAGFNAVFLAGLWLPAEAAISYITQSSSIFVFTDPQPRILYKIGSLLGMLSISFVIVFINSIIIIIARTIIKAIRFKIPFSNGADETSFEIYLKNNFCEKHRNYFAGPRAPPSIIECSIEEM